MGIYVISDIHGCFDEFMQVLEVAGFGSNDELYILGDIIDRGIAIDKCMAWCVDHAVNATGSNIHFLLGNHEKMALPSFLGAWSCGADPQASYMWSISGGHYTIDQMKKLDDDVIDAFQGIVETAPTKFVVNVGGEDILLCHAGAREPKDGNWLVQSDDDLLWRGREWYTSEEMPPIHIVSGHTPVDSLACDWDMEPVCPKEVLLAGLDNRMMHWEHKHDIDCGCVFGGKLGLLRLDDWSEFYVERNSYL